MVLGAFGSRLTCRQRSRLELRQLGIRVSSLFYGLSAGFRNNLRGLAGWGPFLPAGGTVATQRGARKLGFLCPEAKP